MQNKSQPHQEKVYATIVTRNRLELLSRCVLGLRNQTSRVHKILIVDNDSSDGTREWLATQQDLHVIKENNVGSAGGQSRGIAAAIELGAEWIWVMDDDGSPAVECLASLLEIGRLGFRYVAPDLVEESGLSHFESSIRLSDEPIMNSLGGPYNGILLHRTLVNKIGVPDPRFFLRGDEYEYTDRIEAAGYHTALVRKAKFCHPNTSPLKMSKDKARYTGRNAIWRWRIMPSSPFLNRRRRRLVVLLDLLGLGWFLTRNGKLKLACYLMYGTLQGISGLPPACARKQSV
jgi:GT2 family glycosyltransferase